MARRLRTDWFLFAGGVAAAIVLAFLPIHSALMDPPWLFALLLGTKLGCVALFVGLPVWSLSADVHLERIIPQHKACVCPRCRIAMQVADDSLACPRCRQTFPRQEVIEYWSTLVHAPRVLSVAKPGSRLYKLNRAGRPRKEPWWGWLLAVLIILALPPLSTLQSGRSIFTAYVNLLPMLLYGALFGTAGAYLGAYWVRTGSTLHCARCGYQQGPDPSAIERCPECGEEWNLPGGTVPGQRASRSQLLIGLVLLCAAGLMMISSRSWFSPQNWGPTVLPTSALIHDAVHSTGFPGQAWTTLAQRKLDAEQQRQLFTGLLDRRLRESSTDNTAGEWMWEAVQSEQCPPDLVERYYDEMLSIEIDTPGAARVGQPCPLQLNTTFRYSGLPVAVDEFACVGGFEIVGTPQVLARQDHVQSAALLDMPEYVVTASFTPTAAGPVHIRCQVWLTVGDWQGPHEIEWNPDGIPTIPPSSGHTTHLTTERTIEVE